MHYNTMFIIQYRFNVLATVKCWLGCVCEQSAEYVETFLSEQNNINMRKRSIYGETL